MTTFRAYLMTVVVILGAYTAVVGANHGWDLLPIFFSDIAAMTWHGQFNADFSGFLTLSGLWLAWRHEYSPAGLALGVLGLFGGMMVLAPYLVVASYQAGDDAAVLLLGKARAARRA